MNRIWTKLSLLIAAATGTVFLSGSGCAVAGKQEKISGLGDRSRSVRVSAPGALTQPDTEYVLDRDISAEGTAFTVQASGITLNLHGYRVEYGTGEGSRNVFGVNVPGYHLRDIRIVNGAIVQKKNGPCRGDEHGRGCSPIHMPTDVEGVEIARLDLSYDAPDTGGIYLHWGKNARIHHNRFHDGGHVVSNRHQGIAALENGRGEGLQAHHNIIDGARHIGIRTGKGADVYANEVEIDSVATNSVGLAVAGGKIHGNTVVGRGVHPIGIWPGNQVKVFENYVEVKSTRAGDEYGSTGAACLRMTWGNDGVEVTDNLFILQAEEAEGESWSSWGRALWVGLPQAGERALFARNLIVANNRRGKAKAAAVAVVCNNASSGLEFRNNVIISNWGPILLADDYGHADGFPRFVGNTVVRQDRFRSFRTIRSQYPQRPSTAVFIDNRFLNGAGADDLEMPWAGEGKKELRFGDRVLLDIVDRNNRPVAGALVQIRNRFGTTVFMGRSDRGGNVSAEIVRYRLFRPAVAAGGASDHTSGTILSREDEGPFGVTARKGERESRLHLPEGEGDVRVKMILPAETLAEGGKR